jgi:hypothetical protein
VLEYKVRWVGFGKDSDTWRPVQTLADIIELVQSYDSRHPPLTGVEERLELVPRAPQELVEASVEAKQRRHMRSLPHRSENRPPTDTSEVPVILHEVPDGAQENPVAEAPVVLPGEDSRERRRLGRAKQKELRLQRAASAAPSSNDTNN